MPQEKWKAQHYKIDKDWLIQTEDGHDIATVYNKEHVPLFLASRMMLEALKEVTYAFRDGGTHIERLAALIAAEKAITEAIAKIPRDRT